MTPIHIDKLYNEIAEKSGEDKQLTKDFLEFFWKDVKKNLSSLTNNNIKVIAIGTFIIKSRKLAKVIEKYENFKKKYDRISSLGKITYLQYHIKKDTIESLEKLHKVQKMIDAELLKKENNKLIRAEYEKNKANLEKQKTNI